MGEKKIEHRKMVYKLSGVNAMFFIYIYINRAENSQLKAVYLKKKKKIAAKIVSPKQAKKFYNYIFSVK